MVLADMGLLAAARDDDRDDGESDEGDEELGESNNHHGNTSKGA